MEQDQSDPAAALARVLAAMDLDGAGMAGLSWHAFFDRLLLT